jgi:hypothetical protein
MTQFEFKAERLADLIVTLDSIERYSIANFESIRIVPEGTFSNITNLKWNALKAHLDEYSKTIHPKIRNTLRSYIDNKIIRSITVAKFNSVMAPFVYNNISRDLQINLGSFKQTEQINHVKDLSTVLSVTAQFSEEFRSQISLHTLPIFTSDFLQPVGSFALLYTGPIAGLMALKNYESKILALPTTKRPKSVKFVTCHEDRFTRPREECNSLSSEALEILVGTVDEIKRINILPVEAITESLGKLFK